MRNIVTGADEGGALIPDPQILALQMIEAKRVRCRWCPAATSRRGTRFSAVNENVATPTPSYCAAARASAWQRLKRARRSRVHHIVRLVVRLVSVVVMALSAKCAFVSRRASAQVSSAPAASPRVARESEFHGQPLSRARDLEVAAHAPRSSTYHRPTGIVLVRITSTSRGGRGLGRGRARIPIPRAVVLARPLQHLEVAAASPHPSTSLVPRAAVLARPLQHLEVAAIRRLRRSPARLSARQHVPRPQSTFSRAHFSTSRVAAPRRAAHVPRTEPFARAHFRESRSPPPPRSTTEKSSLATPSTPRAVRSSPLRRTRDASSSRDLASACPSASSRIRGARASISDSFFISRPVASTASRIPRLTARSRPRSPGSGRKSDLSCVEITSRGRPRSRLARRRYPREYRGAASTYPRSS